MTPVRLPLYALAFAALTTGCNRIDRYEGTFIVPTAAAVLGTDVDGPFDEPVAYVANRVGGQIHPLAAREGRFLPERASASFLRGEVLGTGLERVLTGVAAFSPSPEEMVVFAADQGFDQLLEISHVIGMGDQGATRPGLDIVRTRGQSYLTDLHATPGLTPQETWTLTWRSGAWWPVGSRSGALEGRIWPDEPFEDERVGLTLTARAGDRDGDQIEFTTSSGSIEHDLGGTPVALHMLPDQSFLAIAVADDDGTGRVLWFDPYRGRVVGHVTLPAESRPTRFDFAHGQLWIADAAVPALWRVSPGSPLPTRYPLPWPITDVAVGSKRLFVAPVDGSSVWAMDLESRSLVDLNPWTPEISGFKLFSHVRGIGALPTPVDYPFLDEDGVRRRGELLAVSLAAGAVVFLDQDRGCLLPDSLGPRTQPSTRFGRFDDHTADFTAVPGGPSLVPNATNNRFILVNNCAGIARPETWQATFIAAEQAWEVQGELSGVQQRRVYEGQRYTSDRGEVSFLLVPGAAPSIDGWTLRFTVTDGALRIESNSPEVRNEFDFFRRSLTEVPFTLPADPIPLTFVDTRDAPGWRAVERPSVAIVPLEGANAVARIRPDEAGADALWR
jgi:hypothetical protein